MPIDKKILEVTFKIREGERTEILEKYKKDEISIEEALEMLSALDAKLTQMALVMQEIYETKQEIPDALKA